MCSPYTVLRITTSYPALFGEQFHSPGVVRTALGTDLRAYDHRLLDRSASAIVRSVLKTGASVAGPILLPTKRSIVTVLRSPHVNKKSREQFEMRVHSRLIDIENPNEETAAALRSQDVPAGVDVEMNEI